MPLCIKQADTRNMLHWGYQTVVRIQCSELIVTDEGQFHSRPLYLKIMLSEITRDSRAHVTYIRSTLNKHIVKFDINVTSSTRFCASTGCAQFKGVKFIGHPDKNLRGYKTIAYNRFKQYIV